MNKKPALIVVYNHKFEKNIDKVEKIYRGRFSNIYHLVPFYEGEKKNVIPVYESSYYFQGYVAQGFKSYFDLNYTHYFFIADDMILNPLITEDNYADLFQLDESSGFIQELDPMPAPSFWGPYNQLAITYDPYKKGTEIRNDLPSVAEATAILKKLNIENGPYSLQQTYFSNKNSSYKTKIKQLLTYYYDKLILNTDLKKSKYPFVRSYADIFIVSGKSIKKFIHYCGVFAATDLWVELAIPTALALSGEKIKVQQDLKLQGKALWSTEELNTLNVYENDLSRLLSNFPKDYIFLHPIKLSQWELGELN